MLKGTFSNYAQQLQWAMAQKPASGKIDGSTVVHHKTMLLNVSG
jgi:hypothetical protein